MQQYYYSALTALQLFVLNIIIVIVFSVYVLYGTSTLMSSNKNARNLQTWLIKNQPSPTKRFISRFNRFRRTRLISYDERWIESTILTGKKKYYPCVPGGGVGLFRDWTELAEWKFGRQMHLRMKKLGFDSSTFSRELHLQLWHRFKKVQSSHILK